MTQMTTPRLRRTPPTEGNLPQLRFPEFKDAGAWEVKPVNKWLTIGSGKDYKHLSTGNVPVYGTGGYMLSVNEYLYDGESVCIGRKGTIDKPMFLSGKFWTVDTLFYTHSFVNCLPKFIYSCFQNIEWSNYNEASGVPSLSKVTIGQIEIEVPSLPEQQKIAACLSSLDDLITTENQQLEALKTHKKGLMQSLFPAEGETVPKHRFPEFKDAGAWEEKNLGDIGSVKMCRRILKEQTLPVGDVPFYKIGTFGSTPDAFIAKELFEVYKNKFSFPKKGAVLISASGTIGRTVRYQGEDAYFQDSNIVWLEHGNEFVTDDFLFYLYQLITWKPSVGAIQRLYNETILCTKIKFPSLHEQQKIAACLSSLDDLISAQSQKIEALKQHKKGLMQQLFPHSPPLEGWQAQPDGVVSSVVQGSKGVVL